MSQISGLMCSFLFLQYGYAFEILSGGPPATLTLSNSNVSDLQFHYNLKEHWFAKFLPHCHTLFLINGFVSNDAPVFKTTVKNLLAVQDTCYNIVRVRWQKSYNPYYPAAAKSVNVVGRYLCRIIIDMQKANILQRELQFTGHSLGAHISGVASRCVQHIRDPDLLTGLDPAGPCFSEGLKICNFSRFQLNSTDAKMVVSLETNGGVLGTTKIQGQIGFIANGGHHQPGCVQPICSHYAAVHIYDQSIASTEFVATSETGVQTIFGRLMPTSTPPGIYYFNTSDLSRYTENIRIPSSLEDSSLF